MYLLQVHRWKPTNEWRNQFQNYMRTLPAYYAAPLRRALTRMGVYILLHIYSFNSVIFFHFQLFMNGTLG